MKIKPSKSGDRYENHSAREQLRSSSVMLILVLLHWRGILCMLAWHDFKVPNTSKLEVLCHLRTSLKPQITIIQH